VIDEQLSTPQELGGPGGDKTNPEQLFAAGYAACFHSALKVAARQAKVKIGETSVTAKVDLGPDGSGGFQLGVQLAAHIPGVEQDVAERLADAAHRICPYSNATRGNIEVALTTTV
jgi:lipoyl-dependent peroxiredoxin